MNDLKEYMNNKIYEILMNMGYPKELINQTATSMAYALGSLSGRDYIYAMQGAFGGNANLDAVNDFLSATYEVPDMSGISQEIFKGVTDYMNDNLP
jgi:hypothetical protein